MPRTIMLVDDDVLLRRSLAFNLNQAGYDTQTVATAEDALAMIEQARPDLVVLDIGLPGMDGLDALRQIRDRLGVPVILLTARRRELDEVLGLELGAEDYVTKPFDLDVLLARIKVVFRRAALSSVTLPAPAVLVSGDLEINLAAHTVRKSGHLLELSPREFDLLTVLVRDEGKVVATDDLLVRVWGAEFDGQPQVVYVHIRWLREKIETDPNHPDRILTVRGVGYKYVAGEEKTP